MTRPQPPSASLTRIRRMPGASGNSRWRPARKDGGRPRTRVRPFLPVGDGVDPSGIRCLLQDLGGLPLGVLTAQAIVHQVPSQWVE